MSKHNTLAFDRPTYVDLSVLALAVLYFSRGWLDRGIPGGDFPGNVAWFWEIKRALFQDHVFSMWNPFWFNGGSRILIVSKLLGFLLPLPLSFLGDIYALKFTVILFHVFAGFTMYRFCLFLTKDRDAAFLGALCYCIHPVYVLESALHGHVEVSLYYAFVPVIFQFYITALREKRAHVIVLAGLSIFLGLWVNNEGSFVYIYESLPKSSLEGSPPWRNAKNNFIVSLLVLAVPLLLGAFFIIPGLVDRDLHAFFPDDYVRQAIRDFSFRNPLYLINRDGALLSRLADAQPFMTSWGGLLYLGLVPLVVVIGHALFSPRSRSSYLPLYVTILALSWALSFGGYPIIEGISQLIRIPSTFAVVLAVIALFLVANYVSRRLRSDLRRDRANGGKAGSADSVPSSAVSDSVKLRNMLIVLVIALLVLPLFRILRHVVPLYSHMRNPLWFYITPGV
ncbi:hypothetical protein ACFL34_06070, partial [Candidatus Sumerlaeota bacterium]